jgi:hypothetical protein
MNKVEVRVIRQRWTGQQNEPHLLHTLSLYPAEVPRVGDHLHVAGEKERRVVKVSWSYLPITDNDTVVPHVEVQVSP